MPPTLLKSQLISFLGFERSSHGNATTNKEGEQEGWYSPPKCNPVCKRQLPNWTLRKYMIFSLHLESNQIPD
jgi:hypothetical protein